MLLPARRSLRPALVAFLFFQICDRAGAQSADRVPAAPFLPAAGQSYSLDLDAVSGTFSQWRHKDLKSLNGLQATLRILRLRKDARWFPVFTILLESAEKRNLDNDLGLQIVAKDRKPPMQLRLMGHIDGKPIEEIPLKTTLKLDEELKVEVTWRDSRTIVIRVGDAEVHAVNISWEVDHAEIAASTGEMIVDPLLFGTAGP
jgi:hypothetical protein